jgi:RNA polymerase sigma-70 factor (ECF subfamily)
VASNDERVGRASAADEGALVRRAQDGDREALDAVLRQQYERTFAICRRLTGDPDDALDATQDALIAIVRGLPRYDGRARFSTWAHRVTVNACLDELRRRRRRPVPSTSDLPLEPVDPGRPDLDEQIADRLRLDAALERLSPEFRAAVVLRDVIGLDYAEIAEVLEVPIGTVRSRIARGRRDLAGQIGRNPIDADDVEETSP